MADSKTITDIPSKWNGICDAYVEVAGEDFAHTGATGSVA